MQPHRRQPTRLPRPWDSPGKNTGVGCHFLLQYMKVKSESEVNQSCPTLRDPMDCSLPGSSIYRIFQARVLEWGGNLMSWLQIKKLIILKGCLPFYITTNHFPIGLWPATERRLYMTTSDDQLSGRLRTSSKALPKAKLAPKNSQGHCPVVCCPSEPLQLSESWWNHYIWEVHSANQRDAPKTAMPTAITDQQKGPDSSSWQRPTICHTTNSSKVEWIGLQSFASSTIFTWPLPNQLPLFQVSRQLFAGKMLSQPAGDWKSFPRVHRIQRHGFLCYTNKQFYFHWQKCVDCNGSYFD